MLTMIRSARLRELLRVELPSLTAALLVAESFFKFHSFTLELLAFLPTWYVFAAALSKFSRRTSREECV